VRIDSVTHHGMGRAEDGTLVPRTLPGEEVTVLPDGSVRIVTPSSLRVAAPCRHFKSCGGCAMQHAADSFVADWKNAIVAKALSGQRIVADITRIETSPPHSRRRAKLSGRRTKAGAIVGFHGRGTETVVAVPDCHLLTPALTALIPALEALTMIAASRSAEVGLTVTESRAGPDILIETTRDITPEIRAALVPLAERYGIARLVWQTEPVVIRNPPVQRFGRADVVPPPGAFLQATREGEMAILVAVTEIVWGRARIADLFAGCGTFTLPLAAQAEVHAVEGEAAMLAALDKGWRLAAGLKKVTTETRDLFRRPLLPDELGRFDAVIIDPPRAGAEAQLAELARAAVPLIAMVSCNPVTFARDARCLTDAGYEMDRLTVVDQFRWSAHVEIVARFTLS
jgi:23S rRNA (uracil1939-C5)-methyltransferase